MKETEFMLTTIDNPYDYFDDFDNWRMFDIEKHCFCCEYLDRIANVTSNMTQKEVNAEIERAIDEIIEINPLKIYKKVQKDFDIEEIMVDEDNDDEEINENINEIDKNKI